MVRIVLLFPELARDSTFSFAAVRAGIRILRLPVDPAAKKPIVHLDSIDIGPILKQDLFEQFENSGSKARLWARHVQRGAVESIGDQGIVIP